MNNPKQKRPDEILAERRMARRELNRDATGLRSLDFSRPFGGIGLGGFTVAYTQDNIIFDLDGYERTEPLKV